LFVVFIPVRLVEISARSSPLMEEVHFPCRDSSAYSPGEIELRLGQSQSTDEAGTGLIGLRY
jgi:hypothetical protein